MKKSLFNFLLEKQKQKTINPIEKKIMNLYLQINVLTKYFYIAVKYCKVDKIQKEVEELTGTGDENYYWFTYHYEAFSNALYSYTKACESILNLLKKNDNNFSRDGNTYLGDFIKDESIDKILKDRGEAVHEFGQWRSELSNELKMHDWKSAETKIVNYITKAYERLKLFDIKIINFINMQMQL